MIRHFQHTLLLLLMILTFSGSSFGQTYGNEWINYNQQYYSFQVIPGNSYGTNFGDPNSVYSGIYMIDYNTLNNAGIPISSFSSENIQIFGKEKEVPLYIVDGGDSSIDPGDYILFYTERNDGWLDSILYNPNEAGNGYYSLYNDTLNYFFTWNTSVNNLRYVEEDNLDFASYLPTDYIIYNRWQSNTNTYEECERFEQALSSFYTHGEGWTSPKENGAGGGYLWSAASVEIKYPYQAVGAPEVKFKGLQLGLSNADSGMPGGENHHARYSIGTPNYIFSDSIWKGYNGTSLVSSFPTSILPASGGSGFQVEIIDDLGAVTDYQSISNWSFVYPRLPIFDGENRVKFNVVNNPSDAKIRIDLSNVSFNNPIAFVHGDVPKKINFFQNGSVFTSVVTNSSTGTQQEVIYQDSSTIYNVTLLSPVNGTGVFTNFAVDFSPEKALLMVYHPDLEPASITYIAYRSNDYNVIPADINELYLQFGGGVEKHVFGVRRFAHYMYENAIDKPVGLFLMGKGINEVAVGGGLGTRRSITNYNASLIPSYGSPSSDIVLTAGFQSGIGYDWSPLIPTGRISARNNTELQDYLDKILEYEGKQDSTDIYDTPNKDWQKQVIHFTGGSTLTEQNQFQSWMNIMEGSIINSLYGANVMRVYKSDSDPLNPTILQEVTDRIQNGVSLMNYYGHASATNSGFEVNLDEPVNWNNEGKYPVMLVNSCYNGNIYQFGTSKSEEFVGVAQRGAIAYIASTNLGYANPLKQYSTRLYQQFSFINYGGGLGLQMQQNIRNMEPVYESTIQALLYETACTQMVLNGDPMVKLNWHVEPEIELLEEYVSFTPEDLTLLVDSIEMHIYLKNLGHSITDTFTLEVIRDFPGSNVDSTYIFQIPELHYETTFSFKMPMQSNIGLGLNAFNISVDLPSNIVEVYDEIGNNQLIKTLFIDVDGIIPVEPYEFAVVPMDSVTVRASTSNPIADFNTYRFELDTIDFEGAPSQFHRYALISGLGGIQEVDPSQWYRTNTGLIDTLICTDSTVYFWRVSIASDTVWRESSFQYIINKEGWGQDHFFQFKKNSFSGINYNRTPRLREFMQDDKTLDCVVKNSVSESNQNAYFINSNIQEYSICQYTPSIHVAIIDPVTHVPWGTLNGTSNPGNNFGNVNNGIACRDRVEKYFIFRQNSTAQLGAFEDFVNNSVPDGHYILIYTPTSARYDLWDTYDPAGDIYSTFAALGSDSIFVGRPNLPFAFFVKKGDPSTVVEYCSQDITDDFVLSATLEGIDNVGVETSTLIGPSAQWHNVYWKQDPLEPGSQDTTILTINAYDYAGNWQMQIDMPFTLDDSLIDLNGVIDANQYPFINLSAYYVDTNTTTPAQIDRWHVLFDPLPEAAIDGSSSFVWSPGNNTVLEGQNIEFAVDVRNIFTIDMDSLLVSYWVEDENQNIHPIAYPRQDSLRVGDILRDTISFSTSGMSGINSLWMEVNPYVDPLQFVTDQPEQLHFNNLLHIPFYVSPDTINPILDVTFDGNHILNGDIVDPNGEILITLKDENQYLIMDEVSDTTAFGVYLTTPSGQVSRIPFTDGNGTTVMQWVPATASNRRFKIIWPTDFAEDGEYTLLVQGTDKSGNISGDIEYRVTFNIVHESTITHMMNYPNPFSTSTRFVFTLTGSDVPDDIIIQIMTVSGRVVREITEGELGEIHIGRNITEYAWDGTDEFGDPLANGVYLYIVKAQINGEDITHRESGADSHFKKNFGKMYLLR
ncbi:MAG: C25 family cysteine peptidase [Crocinitomicaceae bacterium]|nr:C25 family cysteine peptidase [Crocinitomicaceae bacterium]